MRVLIVLDAFRLGGAETLIAQLGRSAHTADLELDVLSLHGPSPEHSKLEPLLIEAGLTPRYLDARRTLDPRAFGQLVAYLRRTRPDIVHAHLEMAMTVALPAARLVGIPAVGTFHQVYQPWGGRRGLARDRLAVEVATRSDATIFVSEASRKSYGDRFRAGRPYPKSWRVVHNGIDVDYFAPEGPATSVPALAPAGGVSAAEVSDAAGVSDAGVSDASAAATPRVVTVVAALRGFKGIINAVRAWPLVLARYPEAKLQLVGTGYEEEPLRAEVARLDLIHSVHFAGLRTDIPDIVRGSEIVLLPSIYGENLPTVLMEAGACGKPVIASEVGGIGDIVVDGETGFLVAPGDSAGIAAAVIKLLDDPELAAAMGKAGRARIVEQFSVGVWAANLRQLYQQVIDRRSGSGR